MENFKSIYEFSVPIVKQSVVDGVETKEVTRYSFAIRKPSRSEKEEAEFVRSEYLGKYIRRGILPEAILNKTYENQGGTLNETELAYVSNLNMRLYDKKEALKLASVGKESKEVIGDLLKDINEIQREVTSIQYRQSRFFENTAEFKAKTKLIEYLFVNLVYWKPKEDSEWTRYFKSEDFEPALDELEKLEDSEDEIYMRMKDKALLAISMFVHMSGNVKFDDIEQTVKDSGLNE
jgi:hypothetical protein